MGAFLNFLRAENFVAATALEFLYLSTGSALYSRCWSPLMGHEFSLGFGLDFLMADNLSLLGGP